MAKSSKANTQFSAIPDHSFEEFRASLSTRARGALDTLGVVAVHALARRTERETKAAKGIGKATLTELKKALAAKGLRFGLLIASFAGGPLDGQRHVFDGRELPATYRLPVGPPERGHGVTYKLDTRHAEPIYKA